MGIQWCLVGVLGVLYFWWAGSRHELLSETGEANFTFGKNRETREDMTGNHGNDVYILEKQQSKD